MTDWKESELRHRIHSIWVDELDLWAGDSSLAEDTQARAECLARIFTARLGGEANIEQPANYTNHFIVCIAADGWSPSNRMQCNRADLLKKHGYALWLEALVSYYVPGVELTWHLDMWQGENSLKTVCDVTEFQALDLTGADHLKELTLDVLNDLSAASIERLELSVTSRPADPSWPCPYPWSSTPPSPDGWQLRHYLFDALSE